MVAVQIPKTVPTKPSYKFGEWSGTALSTAIGGQGLKAGLRGLSTGAKGAIGEGLSVVENTLKGARILGKQVEAAEGVAPPLSCRFWRDRVG